MNILVDMNLSPEWVPFLQKSGHQSWHWSDIGSASASDFQIMLWAREHKYIVFTHDLDFGAILAATDTDSPSVIQIRTEAPRPDYCGRLVLYVLREQATALDQGSLISIDENGARLHILPLQSGH